MTVLLLFRLKLAVLAPQLLRFGAATRGGFSNVLCGSSFVASGTDLGLKCCLSGVRLSSPLGSVQLTTWPESSCA